MTDASLERTVANLLRAGVSLSAAVVLTGGICYLVQHGQAVADYHVFHGVALEYRTIAGILLGALHGDFLAIIQLGLVLLIATPVARVAFSLAAFALERDWTYVGITALVLGILLVSLISEH